MGQKAVRRQWKLRRASGKRLRRHLSRLRRKRAAQSARIAISLEGRWQRSKVLMPETMTLGTQDDHLALTSAMEQLRRAFLTQSSVCLDFSSTKLLFPDGMLLAWAELTRLIGAFPHVQLSCVPAKNSKVSHVLQHLGVYGLLGYTAPAQPEGDDVLPWKTVRGKEVDTQEAGILLTNDPNFSGNEPRFLYEAVSEAVTNVAHHAHLATRLDGLHLPTTREWWMFHKQERDRLFIAVCDLGIGIPRSLPKVHTAEYVREALARLFPGKGKRATDGNMIKAALRIGRTRTSEANRGLGFNDILNIIDTMRGSELHIFSNRGRLTYKPTPTSQIPSIKVFTFKTSILGTILIWSFPLRRDTS